MSLLSAKDAAARLTGLVGVYLGYGADKDGDIDAAFDDAVDAAAHDYGAAGVHVSLASADSDTIQAAATEPSPIARATLLAVRALRADEIEPGTSVAWPVAPDSAFARRRVRVTIDDPTFALEGAVGQPVHVDAALEQRLRSALATDGTPVADDEVLESVVLVRQRARFKPITEVFRTKSAAQFVVVDPARDLIVARDLPTAGAAKKAAVELAKAGPIGADPTGHLEVFKLVGREGGNPLQRIVRTRLVSVTVVKVTLAKEKNAAKTRTVGWLFAGKVAD